MELFPMMKNPRINVANYTTLLKDTSATTLQSIKSIFHTFNSNDDLYDMFLELYRYYEINDEDETVFLQCIMDTFRSHLPYFVELYNNYTKQYDFAVDNVRTTTRIDTSSTAKQEIVNNTTANTSKHYDLPHKSVSDEMVDGYIDDVTKENGSVATTGSGNTSNNYDSSVTTKYDNEFLSLKRQYLAQIRNVNYEFCLKFNDCFLQVYS